MNNADQSLTTTATGTTDNQESAGESPGTGSENCLAIGTRLAEFEITSVIGEGGFGIVYLAFDHSLQRTVAIKEYMPAALAARGTDHNVSVRAKRHEEAFEAGLRSFINEARLLAQFDHSALIKVYRFWEQNKTAYMAMRYYEGRTFKNVVKNNPEMVDETWLKHILKPILEGLDALYKARILHRDISPENIMIQPNGEAVLLDFGAARQIVTGLTQSLTVILKPGYAPVEQYADDESMKQGPWTDIYSLSAVMYSAIAKKPPPTAVARMLSDPIEPLQNGDHPGFGKQFLAALDRGLAVRPEARPQSIAEFATLLGIDMSVPSHAEAVVRPFPQAPAESGNARASQTAPQPAKKSSAKSPAASSVKSPAKRTWLFAAGGVVLAAGAALWFAGRHDAAPTPSAIAVASTPATVPASQTVSPKEEIIPAEALNKDSAASAKAAAPAAKANEQMPSNAAVPKKAKAASATIARRVAEAPAKTADDDAAKAAGSVALAIKPWGNVFVDGDPKGVSPPLKKLSLSEGQHRIKIVNPHFPEYVVTVTVSAKKPTSVSHEFAAPAQ
jgi:serine/threonine protein kinase